MMKLSKILLIMCTIFFIFSCAWVYKPLLYQKAVGWRYGGHGGYLDMEIIANIHLIEVQDISSVQSFHFEKVIANFREVWHQRAKELCPKGYSGEPYMIFPYQAKFDAFRCELQLCNDSKMLSGVVHCNV